LPYLFKGHRILPLLAARVQTGSVIKFTSGIAASSLANPRGEI
jgi:hypothetical protein